MSQKDKQKPKKQQPWNSFPTWPVGKIGKQDTKQRHYSRERITEMNNDSVIVQELGPESKKWQSYYGVSLEGKKGRIVQVLRNSKGQAQGYRVRFSKVKIEGGARNSHRKTVKNFEFAFYKDEVKRIREDLEVPEPKIREKRKMPESDKAAARRLNTREGLKVGELAEKFNVSRRTIYRCLK